MNFDVIEKVADDTKINSGVYVELFITDAATGDRVPLYLDMENKKYPSRALVRSVRSATYRSAQRALNASGAVQRQRSRPGAQNELVEKQIEKSEPKLFHAALVGLENCDSTRPGEMISLSESEATEMAKRDKMQWLVEIVMATAGDDALYGYVEEVAPEGEQKPRKTTTAK